MINLLETIETLKYAKRVIGDENETVNKPIDKTIQALRQALAMEKFSEVNQEIEEALKQPEQDTQMYFDGIPETKYTAPPKREWKGLTSDDKHFLLANAWNKEQAFDGFMDAIEQFLEEKNT